MKGYSSRFIKLIDAADQDKISTKLAKICIEKEIPVIDVAEFFGVSRMTVYNWFKGNTKIPSTHAEKAEKLVAKLSV